MARIRPRHRPALRSAGGRDRKRPESRKQAIERLPSGVSVMVTHSSQMPSGLSRQRPWAHQQTQKGVSRSACSMRSNACPVVDHFDFLLALIRAVPYHSRMTEINQDARLATRSSDRKLAGIGVHRGRPRSDKVQRAILDAARDCSSRTAIPAFVWSTWPPTLASARPPSIAAGGPRKSSPGRFWPISPPRT